MNQKINKIRQNFKKLSEIITQMEGMRDYGTEKQIKETYNVSSVDELQVLIDKQYNKMKELQIKGNALNDGWFDDIGNYYPNDIEQIGETISNAIKIDNVEKYLITEFTGLTREQILNIEKSKKNYTIQSFVKLCNYLKLKIELKQI